MATYIGKKILYRVCNVSYFTLCFIGLIWQVTQISINFFQFDVISDIRLSLPERTEKKAFNFCFQTFEMLNYETYIGMNVIDQADDKEFKYNFVSNLTIFQTTIGSKYCIQSYRWSRVSFNRIQYDTIPDRSTHAIICILPKNPYQCYLL